MSKESEEFFKTAKSVQSNGKKLPKELVQMFEYAYKLGLKDARSNPVTKVDISKGDEKMGNQVSKADLERMSARLEELTDQVNKQLDGSYRFEKMSDSALANVCRDQARPLSERNLASDILLARCKGDIARFVELVKGA